MEKQRISTYEKLASLNPNKKPIRTGKLLNTPESIVRGYRLQAARRDPEKESLTDRGHFMGPYIFSPKRPRIPWHDKINWTLVIECALWVLLMLIVLYFGLSFLFGPLVSQAIGKEVEKDFPVDISVTASVAYDSAKWGPGYWRSPTGTHRDSWVGLSPSMQIKYNRWRLQPTLAVDYRKGKFCFSDWEQFAHVDMQAIGILGGVTYNFKDLFSVYGLAGVSIIRHEATLNEILPEPIKNHGTTTLEQNLLTLKIGVYKTWDIWKLKIGPEIACVIYPDGPGIERCRSVKFNRFVPTAGARVQW